MSSLQKIADYNIIEVLLENQLVGRTTYFAQNQSGKNVVLKQFEFATPRASFAALEAIEKELKVLSLLNHPKIPKYIEHIETNTGFVLVIEYVHATNLSKFGKQFSLFEIERIVKDVLEILEYLQEQNPPIVHRDIKPENILWDGTKAYLVDFGIAIATAQTMTLTTALGGTFGFCPPEIYRSKKSQINTDLYSLGVTIFCLLANIPTSEVENYINPDFSLKIQKLSGKVENSSLRWLQKLAHPDPEQRYRDARSAIEAFKNLERANNSILKKQTAITVVKKGLARLYPYRSFFLISSITLASVSVGAKILISVNEKNNDDICLGFLCGVADKVATALPSDAPTEAVWTVCVGLNAVIVYFLTFEIYQVFRAVKEGEDYIAIQIQVTVAIAMLFLVNYWADSVVF